MAKKQTPLQKAYAKQVSRLKLFIRRAEKRGFQFEIDIIPKKPKKITTKSIERLKKITPKQLYKKSVYAGEATAGEIVSGVAGRKAEQKLASQRAAETRRLKKETTHPDKIQEDTSFFDMAVIGEFKRSLAHYPKKAYPILTSWIDSLISEIGQHLVALMLEEGMSKGLVITYEIAYDDNKLQDFMSDMENYLSASDETRKDLADAMDESESYEEY